MKKGRDYIFGYGSLVNLTSRNKTCPCLESFEVSVQGLERGWYYKDQLRGETAVGVIFKEKVICNGIVFEVCEENLLSLDKREIGYERVILPPGSVVDSNDDCLKENDRVWVYIIKKTILPTVKFPIMQSYVDIIINGCLEFSEKMAREFINSTMAWEYVWVNNRLGGDIEKHKQVDSLLQDELGEFFQRRLDKEV